MEEIVRLVVAITLLIIFLTLIIIILLLIQKKKVQKNRQEKATLHAQYQQEILQTQIEIQNQTLQRLAEELHDNIGQLLSVVRWQLNILEEEPDVSQLQLREINDTVAQAIHELRALSKSLDADVVKDFGLIQSLQHELSRIEQMRKCRTQLFVVGEATTIHPQKDMVLYRIAQEVLSNALKHAHASNLTLKLQYESEGLTFEITDDGRGFDAEAVKSRTIESSGAGLRNIHRRVELLGGNCQIESQIGQGTRIILKIP